MRTNIAHYCISLSAIIFTSKDYRNRPLQDLANSKPYLQHFAEVYLDAVDFVSISVALYGLIVFYALVKERLVGKKPLAKFLCIKFIVMFTFYQDFVFDALVSHGYIKATGKSLSCTQGLSTVLT